MNKEQDILDVERMHRRVFQEADLSVGQITEFVLFDVINNFSVFNLGYWYSSSSCSHIDGPFLVLKHFGSSLSFLAE